MVLGKTTSLDSPGYFKQALVTTPRWFYHLITTFVLACLNHMHLCTLMYVYFMVDCQFYAIHVFGITKFVRILGIWRY